MADGRIQASPELPPCRGLRLSRRCQSAHHRTGRASERARPLQVRSACAAIGLYHSWGNASIARPNLASRAATVLVPGSGQLSAPFTNSEFRASWHCQNSLRAMAVRWRRFHFRSSQQGFHAKETDKLVMLQSRQVQKRLLVSTEIARIHYMDTTEYRFGEGPCPLQASKSCSA